MNVKSVRFRLTLWYSVAFFLAMAVIFAAFYLITKQVLVSHTDDSITSHAQRIVEAVSANSMPAFSREFSETPGMLIVVADPYGKIISSSQALGSNTGSITDLLEKSANIIKPAFTDKTMGAVQLRLGVFPVKRDGVDTGLVLIGHPNDVVANSLHALTTILLLVYFGLLFPTIVGGMLLARGAMDPITQFSTQLKMIGAKNLDERVVNPKTGDEVEELALTFNGLLDRLSEAFNRERRFIGDVAHELKTPLATIRSSVEIALTKPRSKEEYQQILSSTISDVDRLSQTVKNVLDLAWSEADHSGMLTQTFDLTELVEELKDFGSKMGESKKIKVSGSVEKGINAVGIREKMFRAILNLLDNAIKYSPQNGKISISLKRDNDFAMIRVSDNGPGIAREDLPHIFDRFYRGSKTAKVIGSGLGLAIASSIISVHHGTISVDSNVGKGSIFTIRLPVY